LPGATAAVMAHEMGHNFGFAHDNELPHNCACDDGPGKCIMNSHVRLVLHANVFAFSVFSLKYR